MTKVQAVEHYNQGVSLFEQGKLNEAMKEMQAAISLFDAGPMHFYLGVIYYRQNNLDSAVKELERAIELGELGEVTSVAYYNLGMCYNNKKLFQEAADAWREFLRFSDPKEDAQKIAKVEPFVAQFPIIRHVKLK